MILDQQQLQEAVDQVFSREEAINACRRKDLGALIAMLRPFGITQHHIAGLTGLPQGRLSEYKTGKRVPKGRSTFEDFANGLSLPARARLALGLAPSNGAESTSTHPGTSNLSYDTFDLQLFAEAIGKRGNSMDRREMLEMMVALGASASLAQSEVWAKVANAVSKPSAMDESVVRQMEARSIGFHRLEEVVPAPLLFKALTAHLNEVSTLLNGTHVDPSDDLRSRLLVVGGESIVLAGWTASDIGEPITARHYYDTAEVVAKEIDDPAIIACALGYRSYIPSTKGKSGMARALLSAALDVLPESVSPGTLSWLWARHAEESAALGDHSQALTSWGRATDAFSIADPEEDRIWTRFMDQNRFDSYQIATFANIPRKLGEAHEVAEQVLSRLSHPERKTAVIILADIATAHIRRRSANEAAKFAGDGLAILRETGFTMWLPRYEALALSLRRWERQAPVRAYLDDFTMTKRRFASSPINSIVSKNFDYAS